MAKSKADHQIGQEEGTELEPQTVSEDFDKIEVSIIDALIKDGASRKKSVKKKKKKSGKKEGRLSRRLSSFSAQLQRQYAVFKVEVQMGSLKPWKVEKEYTDFKKLHDGLKKRFPDIAKVTKFPKKNMWTTKLKESMVKEQRDFFESYMRVHCTVYNMYVFFLLTWSNNIFIIGCIQAAAPSKNGKRVPWHSGS